MNTNTNTCTVHMHMHSARTVKGKNDNTNQEATKKKKKQISNRAGIPEYMNGICVARDQQHICPSQAAREACSFVAHRIRVRQKEAVGHARRVAGCVHIATHVWNVRLTSVCYVQRVKAPPPP